MLYSCGNRIFGRMFPQLIASLTATISAISDGMQYGWTAPILPLLRAENSPVKITKSDENWLETIYLIAGLAGLPVTIYLVDKIGRKKLILLSSVTSLLAWIITGVATRVEYLYVARFLTGAAADVAFIAIPMYISEIADQNIRGLLTGLDYIMMLIGILIIYAIVPFVPYYVPSVIGVALLLIQIITFSMMPDSPYFLLIQGKKDLARNALNRLRIEKDNEHELEEIAKAILRQNEEMGRPQDLFLVKSNRRAVIIITILIAAQHFSGFSPILMNLHTILAEAGSAYLSSELVGIVFSALMIVAAIFCSFNVDRYGRKVFLLSSSILTGFSLLTVSVYFHLKYLGVDMESLSWIPVVSVMVYAVTYKIGLGFLPQVLVSELFSTKVKAMGMSLGDALYVVFGFLAVTVYHYMAEEFGTYVPFYVFSGISFLVVIFIVFGVPETKGKTLEEIQLLLKGITTTHI